MEKVVQGIKFKGRVLVSADSGSVLRTISLATKEYEGVGEADNIYILYRNTKTDDGGRDEPICALHNYALAASIMNRLNTILTKSGYATNTWFNIVPIKLMDNGQQPWEAV